MSVNEKVSSKWIALILVVTATLIVVSGVVLFLRQDRATADVHDFESCVAAGNPVMESYPEQCAANGTTYTNETQQAQMPVDETSAYIGLSEEEALEKADQSNTPARVVQRDEEALPVTMDFVLGRYNFYVRDGVVYMVEVEGQASDSPLDEN